MNILCQTHLSHGKTLERPTICQLASIRDTIEELAVNGAQLSFMNYQEWTEAIRNGIYY